MNTYYSEVNPAKHKQWVARNEDGSAMWSGATMQEAVDKAVAAGCDDPILSYEAGDDQEAQG